MRVERQIEMLGLSLPKPPKPLGNYVGAIQIGDLLFISGQLPMEDGQLLHVGQVGAELTEQDGYEAARLVALNVLAQIKLALGGFDRLARLVRLDGHVASAPGWHDAPKVLDGASDLFLRALGARGKHTRAAFTPLRLPNNAAVELVIIAAVEPR